MGHGLGSCCGQRLREYFHRTKHITTTEFNNELLGKMSPALQGEVLWRTNSVWLRRVQFMRKCEPEFVAKILLSLQPLVFAPSDVVFGTQLYILHHGVAVYGGKVLTAGDVWGEDMLLSNEKLQKQTFARALNYVEAYSLERQAILALAEGFPASYMRIRVYIGYLALRRTIVHISKEELKHRKHLGISTRTAYLQAFFAGKLGDALESIPVGKVGAALGMGRGRHGVLKERSGDGKEVGGDSKGRRRGSAKVAGGLSGASEVADGRQRSHRGEVDGNVLKEHPPKGSLRVLEGRVESLEHMERVEARISNLDEKLGGAIRSLARDVAAIKAAVGASRSLGKGNSQLASHGKGDGESRLNGHGKISTAEQRARGGAVHSSTATEDEKRTATTSSTAVSQRPRSTTQHRSPVHCHSSGGTAHTQNKSSRNTSRSRSAKERGTARRDEAHSLAETPLEA
mmetsp:Transcript_76761/g.152188  ORF Transcript_76761/g.152188 Transcript_76761/m.152188 type:complete len:457 (+) Transcript_76761:1746-3116(+)